ncbi:hypothetical protein PVL30_002920 [Lodderomyces elongisporus]|uniref:uncharacterized protein n=1 Tax=Lodderomyces elongisporus TaxID=36914 RepID=UPI00291DB8EB|nr:uncharacterized protein PVL30_002920 [Lodderomyces elongisporus]WLF79169.1 hypothetical protein PVL30_002920 [Lodderomyces elongisporus]
MVAEPVQATVQTLNKLYNYTTDLVNEQHEKLQHSSKIYDQFVSGSHQSSQSPSVPSSGNSTAFSLNTIFSRLLNKIYRNKVRSFAILGIGIGIGGYVGYTYFLKPQSYPEIRKRRVPKLANGARRDAVLLIGSPTEPLTRAIALDMERRGFIVFLTMLDSTDSKYVLSHPFNEEIQMVDFFTKSVEDSLVEFKQTLKTPIVPFHGAKPHVLQLKSVIFTPSLYFSVEPVENLGINTWQKLQDRMMMFFKMFSCGLIQLIRMQKARLILVNLNNLNSLNLPYHAPESIFQNELKSLFTILTREMKSHEIYVTQVRLGNINLSNQKVGSNSRIESIVQSEVRSWTSEMKNLYADNFARAQYKSHKIRGCGGQGSSIRELFHLLFDLTYESSVPAIAYCGKGARFYDRVAKILPDSWVSFLLT